MNASCGLVTAWRLAVYRYRLYVPATDFADTGLRPELLSALSELGYEEPTDIQAETLPPLMAGRDMLGQAATGTGKTAALPCQC